MPHYMMANIGSAGRFRVSSCRDGVLGDFLTEMARRHTMRHGIIQQFYELEKPTERFYESLKLVHDAPPIPWELKLVIPKRDWNQLDAALMQHIFGISTEMFPGSSLEWHADEDMYMASDQYSYEGYPLTRVDGVNHARTYGMVCGLAPYSVAVPAFYWTTLLYRALMGSEPLYSFCLSRKEKLTLGDIVGALSVLTDSGDYMIWDGDRNASVHYYCTVLERRWYANGLFNLRTGRGPLSIDACLKGEPNKYADVCVFF